MSIENGLGRDCGLNRRRMLNSEDEVHYWLTDEHRRSQLLGPLSEFADFVTKFTGQDQPDYANIKKWPIADKMVAVLGLNSAWMCGRNKNGCDKINDYGYTVLGEWQIFQYLHKIEDADLKIAVFHHPFEWLAEFDRNRIETPLRRKCNFILNGHQHKPQVQLDFGGTSGKAVLIPAGACYNRRFPENSQYTNSYKFVHLDFDKQMCFVFLRRWSESRKEWIKDIESYDDNGFIEFPWHSTEIQQYTPPPIASSLVSPKAENFDETEGSLLRASISISSDAFLQGRIYSSICLAVEAAKPGDTITVAAGTYYENVQINKSLTIIGVGPDDTIVDGNQAGSVFLVGNNLKNIDVTLSGMTIQGGTGNIMYPGQDPNGGGIYNSARLTVKDCIISGNDQNYGYGYGGGIYNNEGSVAVTDSTISGNTATGLGGGIYNHAGYLKVTNSDITGNTGSGIADFYGTTIIENSRILKNSESGVDHNGGRATIIDSIISGNGHYDSQTATGTIGAGIASYGTMTIARCFITGNTGTQAGGIWADGYSTTMITNSKIFENTAKFFGGGIMANSAATQLNCDPSQVFGNTPDQIYYQ